MTTGYIDLPLEGGSGGSGITSINGNTTAAQVITGGTGISVSSVAGTTTITATGSGSGTVTSVSVTTANGVSGTVATPTTTPAISLTLGAITPSSVAASGTVTGSNLSGTNTGDQTITLTGDVTGSGTGSFAATIGANKVTNAKLAQMTANTIKGNNTAGTANALDLTGTQVTAMLDNFTSTLKGLAPLSGGGTTNYLRADGTWAAPPGATSGTVTSVNVSGGTTGLTTSGGPVTTSGTITLAGTLAIANGGTNSVAALNNNRVMQSSGGAIVEAAAITASRALVSDTNGIPVAATTTTTEINFVNGVTSAIQTQLNNKQPLATNLTALAAYNTNGLLTQTAAGTFAGRTITAGTGISISNGDGVAGNPTISGSTNALISSTGISIDGGGSAITTGIKGDILVPFAATITQVTLLADQTGSIVVDIWKNTYASYPPTVANTITASAIPTISATNKSQDSTLTGWTTSISAGDTLRFNVNSASTITRVTLILKLTRT